MRIVIDMQAAQIAAATDVAQNPTVALVRALLEDGRGHEFVLALSGLYPETIEPLRHFFRDLLAADRLRVWRAPRPLSYADVNNTQRRNIGELMLEGFVADQAADVVLYLDGLIGFEQEAVVSIGSFAKELRSVVLLQKDALTELLCLNPTERHVQWRERALTHLRRATVVAVDSPDAAQRLHEAGIDAERIRTIATNSPQVVAEQVLSYAEQVAACPRIEDDLARLEIRRPRLAYISPLPPERSGISDYSADLLPALARYYDIEVIISQEEVRSPWVEANVPIRSVDYFLRHAHSYARVIYHFGNSHFHQHMFALLDRVPGVVVLHDFFLGHAVAHMPPTSGMRDFWADALYRSHGYEALRRRFRVQDGSAVWDYPCNLGILQRAEGVIVHSDTSRRLAEQWYGPTAAREWTLIPLLRKPVDLQPDRRAQARLALGIEPDDFLVCSFGMLGPAKLNHRLFDAWLASQLARDPRNVLVFVGENYPEEYGQAMLHRLEEAARSGVRVHITGWLDVEGYHQYLCAADVGVQLRTSSRGETSAAVLDCMNFGLATIVNAHGTMADLPSDAILKIPDQFGTAELASALEVVWRDPALRAELGACARARIAKDHNPCVCAASYARAIEGFHRRAQYESPRFIDHMVRLLGDPRRDIDRVEIARDIDYSLRQERPVRSLFIDVTAICQTDLRTGIERVVRSTLAVMLANPPKGYRVEPIYLSAAGGPWHYRYARRYALGLLRCPQDVLADEVVEPDAGDFLLGLDLGGTYIVEGERAGIFSGWHAKGVKIYFTVYDMLPVLMPQKFPKESADTHLRWLDIITRFDGAVCISRAVADELRDWLRARSPARLPSFDIGFFHLGANIQHSSPTRGLPGNFDEVMQEIQSRPTFLMVGTVEPRKGHTQALAGFECLWQEGTDCNLVIVGKKGWQVETLVQRVREHPELGRRLMWIEGASDEWLDRIYHASTCLLSASEGEGFGLPLIEAALHSLPVIARDLPVFREVAGQHAFYFSGMAPESIAQAIRQWLALYDEGAHPRSDGMPHLSWEECTQQLLEALHLTTPTVGPIDPDFQASSGRRQTVADNSSFALAAK